MPERPITLTKSSKDKGKAIISSPLVGPTTVPAAPAPNNPPRNPTHTPFRPKLPIRKRYSSFLLQPPPRSDKTAAMEVSSPPPPPQKPTKTVTAAVSTALPPPPPPQKPKESAVAVVSTQSPPLPPPTASPPLPPPTASPPLPLPTASQIFDKARKGLLRVSKQKYPYTNLDSPVILKRGNGSRDPAGVTEKQNSPPSPKTIDFLSQMEAETSVPVQVQRENPPSGEKLAEWGDTLMLGNGKRHCLDLKLRI